MSSKCKYELIQQLKPLLSNDLLPEDIKSSVLVLMGDLAQKLNENQN